MTRKKTAAARRRTPSSRRKAATRKPLAAPAAATDIDALRDAIARASSRRPPRWNADPDDVRRSVLKLVLTLVEMIRQLLERQAIRRMERGTLNDEDTEAVGMALMRLQETVADLARQFDISPEELNLDLGPAGKLL